jgi:AAA+ superfamily predicted ATPase
MFPKNTEDSELALNNFDVAHLADHFSILKYFRRFDVQPAIAFGFVDGAAAAESDVSGLIQAFLGKTLLGERKGQIDEGRVLLDPSEPRSNHFFVTLHSLRALAILCDGEYDGALRKGIAAIAGYTKSYCMQQCFFSQREDRHEFDSTNLIFALTVYALYDQNVDKDLCVACLEAIKGAQQSNGSWPATHPIMRPKGRPWHITSHEIALCMTWLYFQPRINDVGRSLLLNMMERYFRNWVLKTYVSVGKYGGWFDDHTRSRNVVSGWATAIVCHFLANYEFVLSDHLNRRVIDSLGIEGSSDRFIVDEDAHKRSLRWKREAKDKQWRLPTWPDLPPFSWSPDAPNKSDIAKEIQSEWTDPDLDIVGESISDRLAGKVFVEVRRSPAELPPSSCCSFILPGLPGTRKTSLVETVAKVMGWPLVTVPAATFFERGFDMIESRATEIFRRLNYLRNCVVFFDEFEEFFRERFDQQDGVGGVPEKPYHSSINDRTIAAFLTASMLPRLQQLHHEGRCLIFLATNSEETIDAAIRRPGRFDVRIEVRHPTFEGIAAFLIEPSKSSLKKLGLEVDSDGKFTTSAMDRYHSAAAVIKPLLEERKKRMLEELEKKESERLRQAKDSKLEKNKLDELETAITTKLQTANLTDLKDLDEIRKLKMDQIKEEKTVDDRPRMPFKNVEAALRAAMSYGSKGAEAIEAAQLNSFRTTSSPTVCSLMPKSAPCGRRPSRGLVVINFTRRMNRLAPM